MGKEKKIQIWIGLIIIIILVIGINKFTGTPNSQEISTLDQIEKIGKMGVCYVELPPTVSKDPKTGELSGIFVDMVEFLAESMNVELEYRSTTWSNFPADLNSNRCDLSIAATFVTIPRAKTITFSRQILFKPTKHMMKNSRY